MIPRAIAAATAVAVLLGACSPGPPPGTESRGSGAVQAGSKAKGRAGSPPAGRSPGANDFSVTTFEGGTFSSALRRGTPVVLNFWESW
ncbi:MAG: hypothetical protein M3454_16200 [Actinomycetota bacterium]|nr:hypothetical protein [Actinomycetota bacterium]